MKKDIIDKYPPIVPKMQRFNQAGPNDAQHMGSRGSIGAHQMSGRGSTSAHTATDRVRGNVPVVIGRGSSNSSVGMRHRIPDDAEPQQEQPYVHATSTSYNEQHCSSDGLPQELQDLCVDGDGSSIPGGAQFSNMPESSHAAERRAAGIEDWKFYGFQSEAEYLVWQNDKRRYVKVVGNGWDPYNAVKGVTRALHAGYVEPWLTYRHVPSDTKKLWFEYFRREYKWLPIDEVEVWRKFESTARRRISDLTNKGRTRTKKPDFIPLDIWNEMLEQWQRLEWQEISKRNSANRKANSSIHHLGSIPTHEASRRMEKELGRKVTYAEVFKKAHRKGTDGPYTDSRAEQTMARYDEMLQTAKNASESDSNPTPVDENAVFLQAVGPP